MSLSDLADLVVWLPAGAPLWASIGGPASITVESEELRWLDYRLRVLAWLKTDDGAKGRNQPPAPKRLKYASERDAEAEAVDAKQSAWARRQELRAAKS